MREAHNFYEAQLETSPAQNLRPRAGHALPQNKITRAQPRFIRAAKKKSARAWCGFVVVFPNRQNYNFPSCSSLEARLVLNSSREGAKRMGFHIFCEAQLEASPAQFYRSRAGRALPQKKRASPAIDSSREEVKCSSHQPWATTTKDPPRGATRNLTQSEPSAKKVRASVAAKRTDLSSPRRFLGKIAIARQWACL